MNVSLIGMPGAGKSAVGRQLADLLGWDFLDVDPLIVAAQGGGSLQEVLDRLGSGPFLDAEADVIASLRPQRTVIAPGGSAVLRERGILHLKSLGPVVYLAPPVEVLAGRLRNLATRGVPLAPGQTVEDLYRFRAPYYERYADLTVDSNQPRARDTARLILSALKNL